MSMRALRNPCLLALRYVVALGLILLGLISTVLIDTSDAYAQNTSSDRSSPGLLSSASIATTNTKPVTQSQYQDEPEFPAGTQMLDAANPEQILNLTVMIRPRHAQALNQLALALSSPGSPSFEHYISREQNFRTSFRRRVRPSRMFCSFCKVEDSALSQSLATDWRFRFRRPLVRPRLHSESTSTTTFSRADGKHTQMPKHHHSLRSCYERFRKLTGSAVLHKSTLA